MNAAMILKTLSPVLNFAMPFIQKLIESKVVPALKRKAYERLDDFASDRIEDLSELLAKIKNEKDEQKKKAHLEGFKLGLAALKAIGQKLVDGADTLEKAL